MIILKNGTVPKGIASEVLPDGVVKIGDYALSPDDFDAMVKHRNEHPNEKRRMAVLAMPKQDDKKKPASF